MITRNFNLYLHKKGNPLVIQANQYDSGEQWVFTLLEEDGTQYIPTTGAIIGRKSDGNAITVGGSVVDGKVVIIETEQMTAAAGKAVFELSVDDLTHGTANFIVNVEKKPTDDAVISDSDLSLIEEALEANRGFVITFTTRYFDRYYTEADKTFTEVMEALDAGKSINAIFKYEKTPYDRSLYSHFTDRLTLVRRLAPVNPYQWESFYFYGTPAFVRKWNTASQYTNMLEQVVIEFRNNNIADYILVQKNLQEAEEEE